MALVDVAGDWWTTDDVASADVPDAWELALTSCFRPFRVRTVDPGFEAQIRRRDLAGMTLTECVSGPCRGLRLGRQIGEGDEPFVGVQIVLAGSERFRVDDDSLEVHPGDLVVWNSVQPTEFEITENLHKATVMVPWAQLEDRLPRGATLLGGRLDSRAGIGSVLFSHILALVDEIDRLDDGDAGPIKRATLELIGAAATQQLHVEVPNVAREHLKRVQDYALDHLHEHDLTPTRLARANAISVRYLHRLFEQTGPTVSEWIKQQRLEHCRDALDSDAFKAQNITDVAHQFGFNDSAHFSREFKRRFGLSPARYRSSAGGPG